MPGLTENQTYKNLIGGAYSLGNTLKKAVPNLSNLRNTLRDTASGVKTSVANGSPISISQRLKNLGPITTGYKNDSTRYEKSHMGIDIGVPLGTKIPSFSSGKVTEVVSGKGWTPNTPSYGNYVIVTDNQGRKWRYSHLNSSFVKVGSDVKEGDILGESGASGSTYSASNPGKPGYHLDLRIQDAYNRYVNPFSLIK